VSEDHPLKTLLVELHRMEQVTEIALDPLEASETASLAAHVAARELDEGRADRLYRETEGNPLFVVESVRLHEEERAAGNDQEEPSSAPLASEPTSLPPKVHAILVERLAQLSPQARELAGLAATIGRSFTFSVLAEAGDGDEDALVLALDELWQRRIVREHGADAYDFSHDKLREVAYAGVSPARRRLLHRRVARALETVYASDPDTVSGRLAAHYRQAGLPEQAIPYYRRAGEWALRLSAYGEAIADITQGLELLETLPDALERARQEFGLQIALGVALRATKGWSAPEVGEAYSRAWALGRQAGETLQLSPALWGLGTFHVVRAELRTARELGEQCLRLDQEDPDLLMAGNFMMGMSLFHLGELVPAREHLEHTLAVYDPLQHRSYASLLVANPRVFCLSYASHVLWHLGYPEQALERSHQALSLARELSHPFSLAIALAYGAMLSQFRREARAAAEHAEAAVALCTEHGFAYYLAWAEFIRGWTLAEQGEGKDGFAQMQQALTGLRTTGAKLREPYYLALLAQSHERSGEHEEGLLVLDEAMALMEKTEERFWEAELYRLKGELLPDSGKAEACFCRALDVSRQSAKSLELRAAMNLSRLWRRRGESAKARRVVREVFDRFTEGFDTPDLKEAASLLQELA
jgi:predicted ATPase